MASHAQIEQWWSDYRCNTSDLALLDMNGRYPVRVQAVLEDAAVALSAAIMDNGYRHPMGPTGSYNCRKIGGSDTWSLHAYAVAIDWDYAENPYDRGGRKPVPGFGTDPRFMLTEQQITAVEGIVNDDGDSIWRWLGWTIADFMHFQVNVPPNKCQPAQEEPVNYLYEIGTQHRTYEEVTWLLYEAAGGTIDVNQSAAHQLEPVLGKTDPTLVTIVDFEHIAGLLSMNDKQTDKLIDDGLYALGKEIAALRSLVYG